MASAELSRRVEMVVGYPPLCDMGGQQRREFQEALLEADSFEELPGKWQAAILAAEQNRPRPSRRQERLSPGCGTRARRALIPVSPSAGAVDADRPIASRALR